MNPTMSLYVEGLGRWFKLHRIENPKCKHAYCPQCSPNKQLRDHQDCTLHAAKAIKPEFYTADEDCIHDACALCWMDRRLGIGNVRGT